MSVRSMIERAPADRSLLARIGVYKALRAEGWDVTALVAPDRQSVVFLAFARGEVQPGGDPIPSPAQIRGESFPPPAAPRGSLSTQGGASVTSAREKAFQIAGTIRTSVTDLEILAADIQDLEVDRLVEVLRTDTIRLGDRLALIKRERNQGRA